jgi:pimeloyl-ACP methyl ester carboxylesterase
MTTHWLWIAIPVCLALAGYAYNRIGETRDAIRCPPIGELIDVGGRKLHLIRKGTGGPTVVIVSGAGASSFMWWDHQDKLAELTTIVTYDRAGLGSSDPAPLPRTLEERAAELHALLVQADISPPYVLVGFSFGGLLIRLFTRDHRNDVAGMAFVDSGHEAVYRPPEIAAKRLSGLLRNLGYIASIGVLRLVGFRSGSQLLTRPAELNAMQRHVSENSVAAAHSFLSVRTKWPQRCTATSQ